MKLRILAPSLAAAALLAACSSDNVEYEYPYVEDQGVVYRDGQRPEGILGNEGLSLAALRDDDGDEGSGGGIGVNAYLWRASLDTVSFMPLASADPFGGVIITDWYQPPDTPNERFKVNLFILGTQLRADGLRASVFRQVRSEDGSAWQDAEVDEQTATEMENAILTRARQLRIASS